eukprot:5937612-Prymnesium_polylepis.1
MACDRGSVLAAIEQATNEIHTAEVTAHAAPAEPSIDERLSVTVAAGPSPQQQLRQQPSAMWDA